MLHYVVTQGEIDLEEFIGVLYPMVAQALSKMTKDIKNVEDARFVFKQFDHDGDGLLSQEELRRSGSRFTNAEVEALFAIGDINGDGEIDIDVSLTCSEQNSDATVFRSSSMSCVLLLPL